MTPAEAPPAPGGPPAAGGSFRGNLLWGVVGLCWLFAFAPRPVALATAPGVVALLAVLERARTTRAAVAWVVGFAALAIGVGYAWLAPTVRTFGELDARLGAFAAPVSWLVLAVYAVASTVHLGLFAWLWRSASAQSGRPHPMAAALLLVGCEALPIRFLPWSVGHGAVEVAPLRQLAEWGGIPLVSFAILCLVIPFHEALRWILEGRGGGPARPRAALATFLVGAALYGAGWWRLAQVAREDDAAGSRVRVAVVQANVGSLSKREAERSVGDATRRAHDAYERVTRRAAAEGAELIVWPETALVEGLRVWDASRGAPRPRTAVDDHLRSLGYGFLVEVGERHALLLGGYADEADAEAGGGARWTRRFNVAMLRERAGRDWSIYRKIKLMPFGETMPGAQWFPALAGLLPQSFKMAAGAPGQPPLAWRERGLSVCAFVCYESILPETVAGLAGDTRPDLLVNLTNDSWYGDTWEPHQHLNFARFRAVEHRAPMVRATNTGISAFVSATGEVTHRLPYDAEGVLVADLPLVARPRTVFARIAGWWRWAVMGAALLAFLGMRLRRRPASPSAA